MNLNIKCTFRPFCSLFLKLFEQSTLWLDARRRRRGWRTQEVFPMRLNYYIVTVRRREVSYAGVQRTGCSWAWFVLVVTGRRVNCKPHSKENKTFPRGFPVSVLFCFFSVGVLLLWNVCQAFYTMFMVNWYLIIYSRRGIPRMFRLCMAGCNGHVAVQEYYDILRCRLRFYRFERRRGRHHTLAFHNKMFPLSELVLSQTKQVVCNVYSYLEKQVKKGGVGLPSVPWAILWRLLD